jgi:hypothetical protein
MQTLGREDDIMNSIVEIQWNEWSRPEYLLCRNDKEVMDALKQFYHLEATRVVIYSATLVGEEGDGEFELRIVDEKPDVVKPEDEQQTLDEEEFVTTKHPDEDIAPTEPAVEGGMV